MKRRTWHFYRLSDGALTGRSFGASSDRDLARNTPPGCGVIEGVTHPHAQRVDTETGQLVDWQPPKPSDDYEWDASTRRWVKKREVAAAERASAQAQAEINALELQQLRAIREALIETLPDGDAKRRLVEAEAAIAARRPLLAGRTVG